MGLFSAFMPPLAPVIFVPFGYYIPSERLAKWRIEQGHPLPSPTAPALKPGAAAFTLALGAVLFALAAR